MRNQILLLFAAFFFVLCGFCFAVALLSQIQDIGFASLNSRVWWLFTFVPLGAGLVFLFFSKPYEKKEIKLPDFERLLKETQKSIRGHLKMSILLDPCLSKGKSKIARRCKKRNFPGSSPGNFS